MSDCETDLRESRQQLRSKLKKLRNSFSKQEVEESSHKLAELLEKDFSYKQAKTIMGYLAFGKELSVDLLLKKALEDGKKVYVPFITSATEMIPVELKSMEDFQLDRYGIRTVKEPLTVGAPESLDIVLVPGVAFSKKGQRLGMGAGYYDRFLLKATKALRYGIAYEKLLQEDLPTDKYDLPMDYIVSEKDISRFKRDFKSAK